MKESRMDRIERGLEEFFRVVMEDRKATAELRASIEQDRIANEKQWEKERIATAELRASIEQDRIANAELQEKERIANAELWEKERIANAELRASIAELRESQKKTDEQLRKTDKKLENVSNTLGNLGVIDGKVAEDLFYRNVRHAFRQKNIAFSEVRRNVKKEGVAEYDIVAVNSGRILVVEVKKKMERHPVDEQVQSAKCKVQNVTAY